MSAVTHEIVVQWRGLLELRKSQEAAMIQILMSPLEVTDEQILAATNSYRHTLGTLRQAAPRVYDRLAGRIAPTILRQLFPKELMTDCLSSTSSEPS